MKSLFYILTIVEFVFIIYVLYLKYRNNEQKKLLLLDPFSFFSICWLFLYNIVPLIMVADNNYYYNEEGYSSQSEFLSKLYLTIFYFLLYIFYRAFSNTYRFKDYLLRVQMQRLKSVENFFLFGYYLLILVVTIFYIRYILSFGLGDYFQNRIIINKGLGIISLMIYSSNLLILVLFINNYISKNKSLFGMIKKVMIYLSIILFSGIYLLIGSRLSVILLIIQILFAFFYLIEKIKRKFIVRSGLILFTLALSLSFFGFMRVRINYPDKDLLSEFAEVFAEKITYNIVTNFGKFENIVWMNDNMDKWEPLYGKTFAAGFSNVVPRKIWKNKPLGGGPAIRNWIRPGTYDLDAKDARNITSYTTGFPTEAYMNFHLLGFIIGPLILAFFLALLKQMLDRLRGNILQLSMYIYLLVAICFVFQYGEFLGIFSRTLFAIFPFIIIKIAGKFRYVLKAS